VTDRHSVDGRYGDTEYGDTEHGDTGGYGNAGSSGAAGKGNLGLRVALSTIPFLGICVAVPLVNRVTPYVLGLPFLVFWVSVWTVLTSVCMALVHALDPARRQGHGAAEGPGR
jgi:Protein of unknown function (DUF3311)